MSEDPVRYGDDLRDGDWKVSWSAGPDPVAPIGITITDRHGVWILPLTRERTELLRRACEEALRHDRWGG
jgi:hypothetical protein